MSARYAQGSAMEAGLTKKPVEDSLWHGEQAAMQAQLDWLKAAQAALARNKSTFAVLGLGDVLGSEGHLEKLRALDYGVEEPR
ncbi:MAG: TraB/GumN family protein [Proteobacteria bacterium]|nr:TraB/GumN family protein [Pseudomonadota bacterium]